MENPKAHDLSHTTSIINTSGREPKDATPLDEDRICFHCGALVHNGGGTYDPDGRLFHRDCLVAYYD